MDNERYTGDWPPSPRDRDRLKNFTPTSRGWARWYKGQSRWVCGKSTPLDAVEAIWNERKKAFDAVVTSEPAAGRCSYRVLLSAYIDSLNERLKTQRPRLSARTHHNYVDDLNRFGTYTVDRGGSLMADMEISDLTPAHFSYVVSNHLSHLKHSAFDSVVTRVSAMFGYAVGMKWLASFEPGPMFARPDKQSLRDQRLSRTKSYTATEVAKLFNAADLMTQCWIALGVCGAFDNADIACLKDEVDLKTGVVDYRRRKEGKVKRVIPLPADVVDLLKSYKPPAGVNPEFAAHFFLTRYGRPFNLSPNGKPLNTISILFGRLLDEVGISTEADGRNFSGLRTTFRNLAPQGSAWKEERDIIMGHFDGSIDVDHYLEEIGLDRLRHVVNHVWGQISTARAGLASPGGPTSPAVPSAGSGEASPDTPTGPTH